MKACTPKVSIGLPVYNGEKYLALALDSVLKQDFADFELIISDNASRDGTAEICKAYAARDPRIRYYRKEVNIGAAPNYENVFHLARGEIFKWHAHDDLLLPGFLSRCFEVIDAAPASLVLIYPRCEIIDEHGNVSGRMPNSVEMWEKQPYKRLAHVLRWLAAPNPIWGLIRTDVLRRTQLTGTVSYTVSYWDDCLLAELALYGEIREIPEVLQQHRSYNGNALAMISMSQDFYGVSFANESLTQDPAGAAGLDESGQRQQEGLVAELGGTLPRIRETHLSHAPSAVPKASVLWHGPCRLVLAPLHQLRRLLAAQVGRSCNKHKISNMGARCFPYEFLS